MSCCDDRFGCRPYGPGCGRMRCGDPPFGIRGGMRFRGFDFDRDDFRHREFFDFDRDDFRRRRFDFDRDDFRRREFFDFDRDGRFF